MRPEDLELTELDSVFFSSGSFCFQIKGIAVHACMRQWGENGISPTLRGAFLTSMPEGWVSRGLLSLSSSWMSKDDRLIDLHRFKSTHMSLRGSKRSHAKR